LVICQLSFVVGRGPASRTSPKQARGPPTQARSASEGPWQVDCAVDFPCIFALRSSTSSAVRSLGAAGGGFLNSRKRRERREECRAGIGAEGSEGSAGGTVALGCLCIVLFELPVCRLSQLPHVPWPPAGRPSTFRGRWASSVRGFFRLPFAG